MVVGRRAAGSGQFLIPRRFLVSQWLPVPWRLLCSCGCDCSRAWLSQLCPEGDRAGLMQLWGAH